MIHFILSFILFCIITCCSSALKLLTWDANALQNLRNAISNSQYLPQDQSAPLQFLSDLSSQYMKQIQKTGIPSLTAYHSLSKLGIHLDGLTPNQYVSIVPYAYPCNQTPQQCVDYAGKTHSPSNCGADGFPWVICDGKINNNVRNSTDRHYLENVFHLVTRLSLSGYIFSDLQQSQLAAKILHAWFVDPRTMMHPSLRFGQCIPGVTSGKSSAFMDLSYVARGFLDAVQLLSQTPGAEKYWSEQDHHMFLTWSKSMLNFMLTSHIERESRMPNNHGVYYDTVVLAFAMLENSTESQQIVSKVLGDKACWSEGKKWTWCVDGRLENQVTMEGMLKYEVDRADAGHYVWYTLLANIHLAMLTKNGGKDLFSLDVLKRAANWPLNQMHNSSIDWLPHNHRYAVYSYRMLSRNMFNETYENVACGMMKSLNNVSSRGFWSSSVMGMDILQIAMPPIYKQESGCEVWSRYPKLTQSTNARHASSQYQNTFTRYTTALLFVLLLLLYLTLTYLRPRISSDSKSRKRPRSFTRLYR